MLECGIPCLCVKTKGSLMNGVTGNASVNMALAYRRKWGFHGSRVVTREHVNTGNKEWDKDGHFERNTWHLTSVSMCAMETKPSHWAEYTFTKLLRCMTLWEEHTGRCFFFSISHVYILYVFLCVSVKPWNWRVHCPPRKTIVCSNWSASMVWSGSTHLPSSVQLLV